GLPSAECRHQGNSGALPHHRHASRSRTSLPQRGRNAEESRHHEGNPEERADPCAQGARRARPRSYSCCRSRLMLELRVSRKTRKIGKTWEKYTFLFLEKKKQPKKR